MLPDLKVAKSNRNKSWTICGGVTIGTIIANYLVQKGLNTDIDFPAFVGQISAIGVTFYAVTKSFAQAIKRSDEYNQTKTDLLSSIRNIGYTVAQINPENTKYEQKDLIQKQHNKNVQDIYNMYEAQPGIKKLITNEICCIQDDHGIIDDDNDQYLKTLFDVTEKIDSVKSRKKSK